MAALAYWLLLMVCALGAGSSRLEVSPVVVERNRQNVTVAWSGVAGPTADDWIGVYSPAAEAVAFNCTTRTPVKIKVCSEWSPSHLVNGSGSMVFSLLNMRADYVFGLFRSGIDLATKAYFSGPYVAAEAMSETVTLTDELKDSVTGVHLALGEAPDEMVVMWTTATSEAPVAEWDFAGREQLRNQAPAKTATYSAQDMCPGGAADSSAFIDPGMIHRAVLTGLQPGTNYSFRVGDAARPQLFSPVYSFVSAPASWDPAGVRLLAMADMGTNELAWDGADNGT
jgi:hypothetical protein